MSLHVLLYLCVLLGFPQGFPSAVYFLSQSFKRREYEFETSVLTLCDLNHLQQLAEQFLSDKEQIKFHVFVLAWRVGEQDCEQEIQCSCYHSG